MKKILMTVAFAATFIACNTKKTETTASTDSLKVDSTILADKPAPSLLAFSPINGYSIKNSVGLSDSVNVILLLNQEDLEKQFIIDKGVTDLSAKPDFVINHIVGVVCLPTERSTTISIDKSELRDNVIEVFVTVTRGEARKITTKPAQVFAIEKRDGVSDIQFYVNGKKDKSFFLTGL